MKFVGDSVFHDLVKIQFWYFCIFLLNDCSGESKGTPPLVQFFYSHVVFGKKWPKNRLEPPPLELAPTLLPGKSWIRHWIANISFSIERQKNYLGAENDGAGFCAWNGRYGSLEAVVAVSLIILRQTQVNKRLLGNDHFTNIYLVVANNVSSIVPVSLVPI